ncbi:hypothetical protein [Ulvibacterium marinum]|uniref:Membrane or secreted protein n=1 Tax=Ulvibacterium marinum TaxID=2419782 RepID=A0A3B0CH55_9FLAO|nr:hypothetical protein [Ulvibacterium marinum]RKN82446.1 hypothetical protein D7Z94_00905 [Ulvibacterium marinum]
MKLAQKLLWICLLIPIWSTTGQITPGIYHADADNVHHELKINGNYLIHSVYEKSPAKFIKTLGGFYTVADNNLTVKLEFNSNHEADGLTELTLPYSMTGKKLTLENGQALSFTLSKKTQQDLDGPWLFATRGPDNGQERRGEENPRKTLKYLQGDRFQWIAYNTETMKFFGTGGGSFSSEDGVYMENIEYFSRDNSRVGASLKFNYEIKDRDWHHKGKNSKGEPMYEIWSRRK